MKKIITVRHLHDQNALRTYGQDGPLVSGQEECIAKMCARVAAEAAGYERVRILYTEKTRRIHDTAVIVANHLKAQGFEVELGHDCRLEVMDQGELILPPDYQDGEWFDPLDKAWDAICDEAYLERNIFYRFGDDLDGKYPALTGVFRRFGESMGWSLLNKYGFIADLVEQEDSAELTLVVAQSDLPLLLMEMEVLCRQGTADPALLPYQCWEVYKTTGLQEAMYDHEAASRGDGNFDIPMGYVGVFDFAVFEKTGFNHILRQAAEILRKEGAKWESL